MLKNINQFFAKITKVRGLNYYQEGRVTNVFKDGNIYYATVRGSSYYYPRLEIRDGLIINGSCTCKSYENSKKCKHMASLALYLNEHDLKKNLTLEELLKTLSREELLNISLNLIKNELNRHYLTMEYLNRLDEIIPSINDYLNYLKANNLVTPPFKEKILELLLNQATSNLAKAYELLYQVLLNLGESFKNEALRFIDISSIYYQGEDYSLIGRFLEISYLKEGIITILIKNTKMEMLKSILENLEKSEEITDLKLRLKILLMYDKDKAKKLARDYLVEDEYFLKTYLSLEKAPEETLKTYLRHYDGHKKVKYETLLKVARDLKIKLDEYSED